ncbi:amidohydrolase [Paenibacillus radicis (ex Gao et al. 2016)]|uniref:Amidohydrolase YhaA n=1 Tax=Paenibacillus radicis (ex Gao et al. 2016) TaxID=1737354 RepID=A0A917HU98_9BACL|nr:amidohydrolase [Paenibacillus radicis (ex Gao et al. 2016)]GGG89507.1 putative amidohydrolase YhaA [Paenibacillus radicis (ex Gao et al. 2016)]
MKTSGERHERLQRLYPDMVRWRRYLHQYPELSYKETETSKWIAKQLRAFGCEVREEVGGYGLIATVRGALPGPVVALRADIDALPIQDEKECEYASKIPGVMHACGHDGHTAALLAAASFYQEQAASLAGERRFLFQPAEEVTPGGALNMIRDGALEGVDAIYGVHLCSPLPYGQISTKEGAFMASADEFTLDILGVGGHGGMPHHTVDTIIVGSALVQAVQSIVSRSINPLEPAVVTIGSFQAGSTNNVIADRCRMKGTVRAFDETTRMLIHNRLKAVIHSTCEMYGADYDLDLRIGYPPVVNDDREAARCLEVAEQLFGSSAAVHADAVMAAEDFSYYLKEKPGCFMFVGARNEETGAKYAHHHPKFDLDERAMIYSAEMLIGMAESYAEEWLGSR